MFGCITNNLKGILIVALLWSDTLMRRAFFVMQPYLTDIWRISFTHAAAIVNIWEATSLMLPAVFQLVADKYLGHFKVVVISALSSTLGLGLVTMSLPFDMKKCEEDACIEDKQRALLYIGVALTAIGRGGLSVCVPCLHDEQSDGGQNCLCGMLQRYAATIQDLIVFAVATIIISLITSWNFRFGFPAMAAAFTTLCFLAGWSVYKKAGPKRKGSLLATFFKVFVAPRTQRNGEGNEVAATPQESSFIRHISGISITFIMLGIVSALGNTFFVEQANHMNRDIGFITLPLAAFQLPTVIAIIAAPCCLVTCVCLRYVNDYGRYCIPQCLRTIPSILGILAALVHAILCCVVAAAVEKRRHGVWMRQSQMDKDDVRFKVPMHATWLIVQFYLVACVDVFFRSSIEAYYHAQAPSSLRNNYNIYTDFVSGLGYFSSVILVAVAGKISESGGGKEEKWFVDSVNKSRLDRYYWVLAVLTTLSLGAFCVLAPFSICKNVAAPPPVPERERERERERRGDDDHQGRLASCCFLR